MTELEVPHNREAEESVIGAVLINPGIYFELSGIIEADDFYIQRHKFIWEAFDALVKTHSPIDFLTLSEQLEKSGMLSEIGGASYLTALMGVVPTSLNAVAYAKLVKQEVIRRRLLITCNSIATQAYDNSKEVSEIIGDAAGQIQKVAEKLAFGNGDVKSIAKLVEDVHNSMIAKSKEKEPQVGPRTGLADLDKLLGGGWKKKFAILAGRPGTGKTSIALQFSLKAAEQGYPVAIFSLDMDDAEEVTNVLLSEISGIDNQRLEIGRLEIDEWPLLEAASDKLSALPIIIDDSIPMSIPSIRAKCLAMRASKGLGLVVIDYMMLLGGYTNKDENDRANLLARDLKLMKKEIDCPLIVIHHLNRAIEKRGDGEPILSDLNEGGDKDPDIIAVLYEPKDVTPVVGQDKPMRLKFTKHRKGPTGTVELLFNGPSTTFKNAIKKGWLL